MQREHLYRGKRVDTGEWIEGTIHFNGKYLLLNNYQNNYDEWYKVDPETVGQFTGLTDKNGKKIFEGDHDKDGNCVVFCDECAGWQFAQIDIPTKDICIPCYNCEGDFMFQDLIDKFEVIGDIHDK